MIVERSFVMQNCQLSKPFLITLSCSVCQFITYDIWYVSNVKENNWVSLSNCLIPNPPDILTNTRRPGGYCRWCWHTNSSLCNHKKIKIIGLFFSFLLSCVEIFFFTGSNQISSKTRYRSQIKVGVKRYKLA